MIKCYAFMIAALLCAGSMRLCAQNKPYPQAVNYPNCIKPNNVTQAAMNTSVASYYDYWKGKYLKHNLASLPGGYYVLGNVTGEQEGFNALGSSEGQGYGMVITALMAGHDPNAKVIFDGLFKTARAYRSSENNNLMGWIVADDIKAQGHYDSATDGDMDIAYALILAHYQWGSGGTINYLAEAKKMITNGIKVSNVSNSNRLNIGDGDSKSALNTRPSDWMMSHMRAFYQETNDNTWLNVINTLYGVYWQFTNKYSASTGLISDFVVKNPPEPAPEDYLGEFKETNEYNYNACRVPLRIVMDYAMYGSTEAYNVSNKLVTWIKQKTNNNPTAIVNGYKLNGGNRGSSAEAVFVGPFVAASVISSNNQAFLNSGWNYLKSAKEDYYSDSYGLLCQLFISGNWWKPEAGTSTNIPPQVNITAPANNASFTAPANITLTAAATDSDGTISKVEFFNGSNKIGESANSPYSIAWNNVSGGSYAITAKATDNGNATTVSAVVNVTVTGGTACVPATASSDDGNVAANVLDNDLNTRWSATGTNEWIQLCLANPVTVNSVSIAFFKGDTRRSSFDIQVSQNGTTWTNAATGKQSSGTSTALETFNITPVTAKYVKIIGHGNNLNAWNSYTEVKVNSSSLAAAATWNNKLSLHEQTAVKVNVYPNPLAEKTTITFNLKAAGATNLTVYNINGKPVQVLVNGKLPAGAQQILFDGGTIPSGVYIFKLVHGGQTTITKAVK
ncbi:glycosyl hydrolase family 8 [Chitinophaga nivalis]|uniref:Glucanase n=1 Tax=Chitinophaga nivalis TaxID=2991709 RepID=A0ABT3IQ95_9BACT|nr:glycosyl hydrolase family 8 [Chitinophaga nivalis]MCW3464161.1 glycosyl hydrolase family 8 [Chitinophaga nivalis]MCW3486149.1 glycosyl hydrolase family 8 [Chitinophaga nivalis]